MDVTSDISISIRPYVTEISATSNIYTCMYIIFDFEYTYSASGILFESQLYVFGPRRNNPFAARCMLNVLPVFIHDVAKTSLFSGT